VLRETPEDWDNVMETQLNAVFLLSKLAAKSMLSRKRGKIINIGSMYSYFGSGLIPSYSAAKGAVVQLTKSMAIELAPHNIQVNAIAPGWIETDMTAPVRTMDMKPMNDEILARTPAGRWGQAEEVAGTAVYLAGRASDFVTGENDIRDRKSVQMNVRLQARGAIPPQTPLQLLKCGCETRRLPNVLCGHNQPSLGSHSQMPE
jgi:2-deoxy-D-gluconate 3-dehydrogenase